MSTDPVIRRAIAQRAIDRARSRGTPIDEDPILMALLDAWISGEIDMRTVRERYFDSPMCEEEERLPQHSDQVETSLDNDMSEKGPTE
jgi:hypothetical protein